MLNTSLATLVPAHERPALGGVSTEMHVAFQKRVSGLSWPERLPTSNEEWSAFSNADPKATRDRIQALAKRFELQLGEISLGGVRCFSFEPDDGERDGPVVIHFHSGGYVIGGAEAGLLEPLLVAGISRIVVVSVDYRLAPDFPFPAALEDAAAAWLEAGKVYAGRPMGLSGTSSGGALAISLVQHLIEHELKGPTGLLAGTPWSDLSETGDSYFTNKYSDCMTYDGLLGVMARQYAGGIDLRDPRISPVYGSFDRFPPTLLLTGTRDLFLSNTVRVDRKIRDEGGASEIIVYDGMCHAQYMIGEDVPETKTALRDIKSFWAKRFS